jgi:hypothetical protein
MENKDSASSTTSGAGGNMTASQAEIYSRFGFHKPDADGVQKMTTVRKKVRELAMLIDELCPNTREKATALTQLGFVMMSANSAIVQQYPLDPADFT